MPKPTTPAAPAETVELYDKLVATNPKVEKKGATMPYTSVNGNMFSVLAKDGRMGLRLPKDAREEFLRKYKAKLMEQYGTVQPEYVEVPSSLLKKTSELKKYFDVSYNYVSSLRPKPTTKKKR